MGISHSSRLCPIGVQMGLNYLICCDYFKVTQCTNAPTSFLSLGISSVKLCSVWLYKLWGKWSHSTVWIRTMAPWWCVCTQPALQPLGQIGHLKTLFLKDGHLCNDLHKRKYACPTLLAQPCSPNLLAQLCTTLLAQLCSIKLIMISRTSTFASFWLLPKAHPFNFSLLNCFIQYFK
jgi:hypothetical protein